MDYEIPAINTDADGLKLILGKSKTIAVVGLSPKPSRDSHKVAAYLQAHGYKIIPVYPRENIILGEKVFRNLLEIESRVDIVDVFRNPSAVPEIVEQSIKRGDVQTIWLQLGIVNNAAAAKAKNAGLNIVQNKCIMIEHKTIINS